MITSQRFGRLIVLREWRTDKYQRMAECRCDCGTVKAIRASTLTSGDTQSCGCLARECIRARNTTHGKSGTPEFGVWHSMIQRCEDPNHKSFKDYGGRGISVCQRWRGSFADFIADMGARPSADHQIDRRDNDGNYCPDNCGWATRSEQALNRRERARLDNGTFAPAGAQEAAA